MMTKLKTAAAAILLTVISAGFLIFSGEVSTAVALSIKRCIGVLIPSLFAFMAISKLIARSGAADNISKPFNKIFSVLLDLPKGTAAMFLISNIAGYPVGASMLEDSVSSGRLDRRSAEIMSIYCYSAGPAFIINAVGVSVFNSSEAGAVILMSVISTNMILAAIVNRIYKPKEMVTHSNIPSDMCRNIVDSATSAGEALLSMCFIIIVFSAVISVADSFGCFEQAARMLRLNDTEITLIRSSFEITNLSSLSSNSLGSIEAVSVLTGFGGVCVLTQIRSLVGSGYSLKTFYKWIPLRAFLNYFFSKLYCLIIMDDCLPVYSAGEKIIVEIDNFVPSICLIMMIFLLVFQKRVDFLKRV